MQTKHIGLLFVVIITFFLGSCATAPDKISDLDKKKNIDKTLGRLHSAENNKVLNINLRQAINHALLNNLEYKVNNMQTALTYRQYDLAKLDMYPELNTSYGYSHRNKDYIKNLTAAAAAADPQALMPRTLKNGSMLFNWSIIDFGLSYVRAKQAGDRYLAAQEVRKKAAMQLVNDVSQNYALAYYGQEMTKQLSEIYKEVTDSLALADKALDEAVGERQQLIDYKTKLLEQYRQAKDYIVYFNQARDKLLTLINYNSGMRLEDSPIKLLPPDEYITKLPSIKSDLSSLDVVALFNRPEFTQSLYKTQETKRQKMVEVLSRLPTFGFNMGYNYDSDKYLLNQNWLSDNMTLAWNLLKLASIQPALDTNEAQVKVAKLTQMASSAVVLGELRVLLYNYKMKKYDYNVVEKSSRYASDMYKNNLNLLASGLYDQQSVLKDKITAINGELAKLRSFIDARNILEDIILALGMYQFNGELLTDENAMNKAINQWIDAFDKNEFDTIIAAERQKIESIKDEATAKADGADGADGCDAECAKMAIKKTDQSNIISGSNNPAAPDDKQISLQDEIDNYLIS